MAATATRRTRKAAAQTVEAPFGFKADGTPRKRPAPTWLNGDKKAAKPAKAAATTRQTVEEIIAGADAPKPARKATVKRDQDSITGTFQRGKWNAKTETIEPHEPKAGGGVRFEDTTDRGFSPVYVQQEDDVLLGKPQQIRVTIKALS
jgi:hypothetical protein